MSLNVELLEQSFEKVKPHAEEFAASFYENLFAAHPEIKPLFTSVDLPKQNKKLINALMLVVENLRNPQMLGPVLQSLGARHVGYGAIPKHYGSVGQALLLALEQYLQEDWTPEVKQAWVNAYRAITQLMLEGAGIEHVPEEVQLQTQAIPEKQIATVPVTPAQPKLEEVSSDPEALPVELLEASFEKVKPQGEDFAASFYSNLFAAHPEMKPLFASVDLIKQQKKLINALVLVVENLRNPEALRAVLTNLGARHISYGAIPKHYGPVGQALLLALEQYLQEDWTPEVKQAWVSAYRTVTQLMLEGASVDSAPKVVRNETPPLQKPRELEPELKNESQPFKSQEEQQKKSLVSVQKYWEIFKQAFGKISHSYRQFLPPLAVQRWSESLKQTTAKLLDSFWTQPTWLIASVSAILFLLVYVTADDNSLLAKVLEASDALSLVIALILFIKEAPDRRKQFHYQAWSAVDAAHGVKVSYARIMALQDLNHDGVPLKGLDAAGADLADISLAKAILNQANLSATDLSNANLSHANLANASLSQAKLSGTNLSDANLSFIRLNQANLSSANLSNANLICADLSNANLSGANLRNATLSGSNLESAYLGGANLKGAKVTISELSAAFLEGAILPDGTKYKTVKDLK